MKETLEHRLRLLKQHGFQLSIVSWDQPLPHLYRVRISDRDCPRLSAEGFGTSRTAALVEALGQLFAGLSCQRYWSNCYLGSDLADSDFVHHPNERWFAITDGLHPDLLDTPTRHLYNPDDRLTDTGLTDIGSGNPLRGVCALPFVRQTDQSTVWFPVNVLDNLYGDTGVAAGHNRNDALLTALSDCLARQVGQHIQQEGIRLPAIPSAWIDRHPHLAAALKALQANGALLWLQDASLGGRYPVLNITWLQPDAGRWVSAFGAHPDFATALQRTLIQLVACADELEAQADTIEPLPWSLLSHAADYPLGQWQATAGNTSQQVQALLDNMQTLGATPYLAEYTHLGVYCCRILLPGISEQHPSSLLVDGNNNRGVGLRDALLQLPDLSQDEQRQLWEILMTGGFDPQQTVASQIGVLPDADTHWHDWFVAELQCMLALALGKQKTALALCADLLQRSELTEEKRTHYRCLHSLLGLSQENHLAREELDPVLSRLFTPEQRALGQLLVEGRTAFYGCRFHEPTLRDFHQHTRLLDAYRKVHRALEDEASGYAFSGYRG